jgi:hypothetical protein
LLDINQRRIIMNCQGMVENLRAIFFFIFGSLLLSQFEILNHKSKVSKVIISILFSLLFLTGFAQETHNLEIIWERGTPGDSLFFSYGSELSSGDFNGDSYSDIVVKGDSAVDRLHGIYIFKAYIFFGGQQFDTFPDVVIASDTTWGFNRAKGIGDINRDGFDDLALGDRHGPDGYGRVYIYLGGNPMDTICDFQLRGPLRGSEFGYAVSSGDVNGDLFSDVIVGAYWARGGYGAVYIYFGGPDFNTIPDVTLNGGHENDLEGFGSTVSGGGDVNGDGYGDVIIGAGNFGPALQGRVYIYFGGDPMNTIFDIAMSGEEPWEQMGWSEGTFIINRGDYDHAVIGSDLWLGGGGYYNGRVCVLFGGPEMDSIPDVVMVGRTDTSRLGCCVANAGFVNDDESSDILVGAPIEYNHFGTAYLWLGGTLLDTIPDAWIRGTQLDEGIGWMVASAGDVDGDGKDEFIVSNYVSSLTSMRVWVCKYVGPGVEERFTQNARRFTIGIKPNPAKSVMRVCGPFSEKTIKIFDVSGKMIKEIEILRYAQNDGAGSTKISLKGINPGIYFLRLGKETKKFLVVK